ncbi:MAG TPA: hypothetical protein VIM88_00130 [Sulfurovum sp.]|uniref:hypothetical protein n=1 Tax=Sulfurovum sp. TaxID=1969726 RepID=UPI002F9476F3
MKKMFTLLSLSLLLLSLSPSYTMASVALGKKLYKKKFYKSCGFSGVEFARKHTQAEWEEIYRSGGLPQEARTICPSLEKMTLKTKDWKSIHQYVTKYASDGAYIPNGCTD